MKTIYQQLLEAKGLLTEDFKDDAKDIMGKDLAGAVADLKAKAGDGEFKKGAVAGEEDGKTDDESATFSKEDVAASEMFPTQAEIGFSNSLADLCNDKFGAIDAAFTEPVLMPANGPKTPILCAKVGGETAILDGHHRWSLCYMINPDAKMSCDVMSGNFKDAGEALKVMQFAIAAKAGTVKTKEAEGKNLMAVDQEVVEDYVLENIGEKEIELFKKYKPELDSKEKIAEYVGKNHALIKASPGPFPRPIMPQAGENGLDQGKVNTAIEKGEINYNEPYVKENSLKESFQRRAGIIK